MKEEKIKTLHNKKPLLSNSHIGHAALNFLNKIHKEYDKVIDVLAAKTARSLDRSRLAI